MMKQIILKGVSLVLKDFDSNVKVILNGSEVLFKNQTILELDKLIKSNFKMVSNFYLSLVNKEKIGIESWDIDSISIAIVIHYLYMYNLWRTMYQNQKNRDLKFIKMDLQLPTTHDIIIDYFKTKYPNDWEMKCSLILTMDLREWRSYYKEREKFYGK